MKTPRCCRILFWTTMFSLSVVVGCGPKAGAKKAIDQGTAAYDKGDFDLSITCFTEAIRLKRDDAWAYYGRGSSYLEKNHFDKAVADFTEAIRLKPDFAEAYYNRGLAYKSSGNVDNANVDFARAKELGRATK